MIRSGILLIGLTLSASTVAAPGSASGPEFGAFGIDLTAQDKSVRPGDDFLLYAVGHWQKTATIPPDRVEWGPFDELAAKSESDVRRIVEAVAASHAAPGTNEQKIADYYNAYMDTAAIERLGLAPARKGLDEIAALSSHEQVAALIGTPGLPLDGPVAYAITLDQKNPDRYIVNVGQSGLSLPDREYYLKTDPQFVEIRTKFQSHVEKMLALAGHPKERAKAEAQSILAFETAIARLHWEIAKRRERELTYNLMSVQELEKEASDYPWGDSFKASGLEGIQQVVVAEKSAITPLAKLFRATPIATLKSYLTYQFLTGEAAVLPKAFDEENFDFYGRILNGQPQQRERWKRATQSLDGALGEAVGQL